MDPLDGYSNIRANVSVGSIFAVYKRTSESELKENDAADFLQKVRFVCFFSTGKALLVQFASSSLYRPWLDVASSAASFFCKVNVIATRAG